MPNRSNLRCFDPVFDQALQDKLLYLRRACTLVGVLASIILLACPFAAAVAADARAGAAALAGEVAYAQKMGKLFPELGTGSQSTPAVIPQLEINPDSNGAVATFQPNGPTKTANNAFFQSLGTNGRTCFTCHQPQDGWTISAEHVRDRFRENSNDPLFRLIDGATCPSDDVSSAASKLKAYSLLLAKGLIRNGIALPSPRQFEIVDVADPYNCTANSTTGLSTDSNDHHHDRLRVVVPPPLADDKSGLPEHAAVGWAGAEPFQVGGRCDG